jgi:hypothetical protein
MQGQKFKKGRRSWKKNIKNWCQWKAMRGFRRLYKSTTIGFNRGILWWRKWTIWFPANIRPKFIEYMSSYNCSRNSLYYYDTLQTLESRSLKVCVTITSFSKVIQIGGANKKPIKTQTHSYTHAHTCLRFPLKWSQAKTELLVSSWWKPYL